MLLAAIRKVLDLGIIQEQNFEFENHRNRLFNQISLFTTIIISIIGIAHLIPGFYVRSLVTLLGLFASVPPLFFQSKSKHRLARRWYLLGLYLLIAVIFFHSVQLDLVSSTEFLPIILIPLVLIFLDGTPSVALSLVLIITGSFFILFRNIQSEPPVYSDFFAIQTNWFSISLSVFFCTFFFKKSIMKANAIIAKDKDALAVADRTKNFLFAVISHDLRSPLSSLKQYLMLDQDIRNDSDLFMKVQDGLTEQVDTLSQTLEDLLFWSQTQLQGIIANPISIHPNQVIEKEIKASLDSAKAKRIRLMSEIQTDQQAFFDQDHLTIIIRNLVRNAIKFTPENGTITLEAAATEHNIQLTVKDTGQGMDEKTLVTLREGRLLKSQLGTANEIGSGLGLSLVRELLIKNQGDILIESQLGKGSSITCILPKAVVSAG